MASFFSTDQKKLKGQISRYRRTLKTNERDGAGKRFLVGPMYLVLGDLNGALGYYEWYGKAYPDDSPEPYNHLSWALALYKSARTAEAVTKLRQTFFENLYLIPHLLGDKQKPLQIWHGSNWAELDYAVDIPDELLTLWDNSAKVWASSVYNDPVITRDRERFVKIEAQLLNAEPGSTRSALVNEAIRLRDGKSALTLVQ